VKYVASFVRVRLDPARSADSMHGTHS
jgi:hypothetical protein